MPGRLEQFRPLLAERFDAFALIRLGVQIDNHNICPRGETDIVAAAPVKPLGDVEILRVILPGFGNAGLFARARLF